MHYLSLGLLFATIRVNSHTTWERAQLSGSFLKSLLIAGYHFSGVTVGFLERVSAGYGSHAWRWKVATWRRVYCHLKSTTGEQ